MNETIHKLEKEINFRNGWNSCGMKVIQIIEKHYDTLPKEFLKDVEKIFESR